jgi:glycosyltransferase involved in cell wall biosynthesis
MLGYGTLLLEAARDVDPDAMEIRGTSVLSNSLNRAGGRLAKAVRDLERFALTPVTLLGRSAKICHVVDPGNATYLGIIRHRVSIVTVHDVIPYLCLAGKLEGFRPSRAGRWVMQRILARLERADCIVCVSNRTRTDLLQLLKLDPSRVRTIQNAVFQPMGTTSVEACAALREEYDLPLDAPFVLHVGQNFYKNRKTVLEIFARIAAVRDDVRLVLVGSLSQDLVALTDRLGLTSRIHVLRYVASDRMAALYTTATLLLFPSLYEGFGYPVLEAQLCGTPVVCSDAGSLAEVAGAGARVFAPQDRDGMTEAALEILEYPAAAADLVARGRENAERYTRGRWFAAHHALYRELV